ncbi:MAG TPA: alpha/beta hydrolase [Burkholderiales bacterium]|nr:alpha/beta hydrolase [Burkholderiales bacterium]
MLILVGCASYDVADRTSLIERIAEQHRFRRMDIRTDRFDLVSFVGLRTNGGVLRVYIEGDGFAWVTRREPSRNPTPINPIAFTLAVLDDQDVVYLARPCQYTTISEKECNPRYWTSARFAPEVIEAMDEAITRLKRQFGDRKLMLIGYSGGGTVAALIAARRNDVAALVTVAGNVDHKTWTRLHALPELRGSLNPPDHRHALAGVRQTHFVGEADNVVPIDVYRSYRKSFPEDANILVNVVPRVDHSCCWDSVWPDLLKALR